MVLVVFDEVLVNLFYFDNYSRIHPCKLLLLRLNHYSLYIQSSFDFGLMNQVLDTLTAHFTSHLPLDAVHDRKFLTRQFPSIYFLAFRNCPSQQVGISVQLDRIPWLSLISPLQQRFIPKPVFGQLVHSYGRGRHPIHSYFILFYSQLILLKMNQLLTTSHAAIFGFLVLIQMEISFIRVIYQWFVFPYFLVLGVRQL